MNKRTAMMATTHERNLGGRFIGAVGRLSPEANSSSNQVSCEYRGIKLLV